LPSIAAAEYPSPIAERFLNMPIAEGSVNMSKKIAFLAIMTTR
jgi:hypothetical protein